MHKAFDESNSNSEGRLATTVSVVMVTYNHAAYIEEAITSVLSQDFSGSFELIIGDDCSTDGTTNIVNRFHELHPDKIKLVASDSNIGADANFRRCIQACTGEYIALCEGDDYWHDKNKLQIQIDLLIANPDIGAVHSDFRHAISFNKKWRLLFSYNSRFRTGIPSGNVFDDLIIRNFIQTCTVVARARHVHAFFESDISGNSYLVGDWPLFLFISTQSMIAYINLPLATYRKTKDSLTNRGHERDVLRTENSILMTAKFCEKYHVSKRIERNASNNAIKHILNLALESGDISLFEKYWLQLKSADSVYTSGFRPRLSRLIVNFFPLRIMYPRFCVLIKSLRQFKLYR